MNTKHTPGPWHATRETIEPNICEMTSSRAPAETAANACLIAAAPTLAAACSAVMEWARTPGDHGGNPYCKAFVRQCRDALEAAGIETP